jgi:uncharacterized protein YjbI with pentapeptide repeats
MNKAELAEALDKHRKWRLGEEGGERADLAGANLTDADLAGAYLARADLADANLADANLADANLAGANLASADLAGANLAGANLAGAYLTRANLAGADLVGANLAGANLAGADLAGAYLTRANLADANLAGASASHNKYVITACLTNYQMVLFQHKGTVLVTAGCHRGWTIEQALAHWMPENRDNWTEKTPEYGQRQLAMLNFLVEQAKALGWIVED